MANYDDLSTVRVRLDGGVATVTIDHPPINLFDVTMMTEFARLGDTLAGDDDVRAVVLESANPDFFIAHADVGLILGLPRDAGHEPSTELNFFHAMVERFRTMPKATIAKVAGIVRGGGSELVASVDMRFAARESAVFGQPEVALGILPGGSGTQRLPGLIGRGRAMEVVLGCGDIDATTAESWGWINRALPAAELDGFVDALATRIASFPAAAVAEAKACVLRAETDPVPGLLAEGDAFSRLLGDAEATRRMERFLEIGGQTRDVEVDLTAHFDAVGSTSD